VTERLDDGASYVVHAPAFYANEWVLRNGRGGWAKQKLALERTC
jgi:hypothetical protein